MIVRSILALFLLLAGRNAAVAQPADARKPQIPDARTISEPPTDWVDPATGHRVIRLSREPGSTSLYFHQNAYSVDRKKLIITTPSGLSAVNLQSREIEPIVQGPVRVLVTGRKTGHSGRKDLIQVGYLRSERLVDLSRHNYRLEPNVTFTPDGKWIVFRSNMHGPTHVYEVQVLPQ